METVTALVALAVTVAGRHDLDPVVFCRLIEAESSWQIDAVSPTGSLGLGQINPRFYHLDDYFDPVANLTKAAEVLRWNLDYRNSEGDLSDEEALWRAVASYNMGYFAVNRLIEQHGPDGWREQLSPQVAGYLDKILGGYDEGDCVLRGGDASPGGTDPSGGLRGGGTL